jgi:hypothetical protein
MFNNKSMLKFTVAVLAVFSIITSSSAAYAGLANKYPGDVGIESDPNVVFTENFEEGSLAAVLARWEEAKKSDIMSLVPDTPPPSSGSHSILFAHVEGQDSAHLYRRLLPGYDQLYLRFYVKFATDGHREEQEPGPSVTNALRPASNQWAQPGDGTSTHTGWK